VVGAATAGATPAVVAAVEALAVQLESAWQAVHNLAVEGSMAVVSSSSETQAGVDKNVKETADDTQTVAGSPNNWPGADAVDEGHDKKAASLEA